MATSWIRSVQASGDFPTGTALLGSISAGNTLLRTHFGWGVFLNSPLAVDLAAYAKDLPVFGLCTTIGNGTETVPDPRTDPGDAAPPTQRWLWWEARGLLPGALSAEGRLVTWRDSGPAQPCDSKGQVTATGLGEGETLNVWASWAFAYGLDDTEIDFNLWCFASMLVATTV